MDRENQYYSIIKNIVEQHKKYVGLETILDDIIDDVYSHSEIILKSVANESVINAYLVKVVSTSIITVPKKMNFHPEIRHRTVTIEKPAKDNYTKPDNSLVDKMINSFDTKEIVVENNAREEMVVQTSDNIQNEIINIEAVATEVKPEESFENIEPSDNDNVVDNLLTLNESNEDVYTKVDNYLVDKMINSPERIDTVTFTEDSFDNNTAETNDVVLLNSEFQVENLEQDLGIIQDDTITLEPEEPEEELSALDVVDIESVEQTEIIEDNTLDEEVSPIAFTNETGDIIEETESLAFEDLGVDSDFNAIQPELSENQEEIVLAAAAEEEEEDDDDDDDDDDELLLETDEELNDEFLEDEIAEQQEDIDSNDELALFDDDEPELNIEVDDNLAIAEDVLSEPNESISFEDTLVDKTATDEVLELEIASDASEENEASDFKPLDYSGFEFVPDIENNDFDINLIVKELENLDNKKPELDIINVYNLKYKENMQISQIASKLEMSEDLVIEALNEIIAVV